MFARRHIAADPAIVPMFWRGRSCHRARIPGDAHQAMRLAGDGGEVRFGQNRADARQMPFSLG